MHLQKLKGKTRSNRASSNCVSKNKKGWGEGSKLLLKNEYLILVCPVQTRISESPYLNYMRKTVKQIEAKDFSLKLREVVREVVQQQRTI